jgi:hypothetical protein
MNWGDFALRFLVRRRDRDTISGDLLEAYREDVLPSKGALGARLWYARQIVSFFSPVAWGVAIGLTYGVLLLVDTAIEPLGDDSGGGMILVVAVLMPLAGARSPRFADAVVSGIVVGIATMAIVHLAAIVRVNLFLDEIRQRGDWISLVSRFNASGFHSLRVYASYEYLRQAPLVLALGAAAGGVCGAIAGAINGIVRAPMARPSR